jgi:hypothetical protein
VGKSSSRGSSKRHVGPAAFVLDPRLLVFGLTDPQPGLADHLSYDEQVVPAEDGGVLSLPGRILTIHKLVPSPADDGAAPVVVG